MGLFDDIGGAVNKGVNSATQAVTGLVNTIGSYYGFDPSSGKWTNQGGVFKWMDEGIGQLTGRNQSRAALNFAQSQYGDAQANANAMITQQNWNRQQSDVLASNSAGAASKSAQASGGANFTNATPTAMGPGFGSAPQGQKDFLGL